MRYLHHTNRGRFAGVAVVCLMILVGGGPRLAANDEDISVRLLIGRSAVVNTDWPIARVSVTSADIADAVVTLPNQVLIQGKAPGTISMFLWDRGGTMTRYDVIVERDLSKLEQQVRELFPGDSIRVESNGKSIVLAGTVSTKFAADKAVEVAAGYVEKKDDVVSLLQVQGGPPAQVLLKVRFAEVSRSALTELGSSFFTGHNGYKDWVGRASTQQFPAPDFNSKDGGLVFSDFLNLFVFNIEHQLGAVIKALQTRGLFQSLAEPNLVAETGKEASFLAGGEFPIPVAQAGAGNLAISVVFKEFGIRLNFTPTVTAGNRVRLKVRPEVSTLDFSNAVTLQGFRIPALSTRRTETELELNNGQTFAIAGLLNNTATQTMQKIPGIGDIPILGLLFRSKAAQKNQTELVVMITPQILPPNSPGVTDTTPRLVEPYMAPVPPNKSFPTPPPAFTPGSGDAAGAAAAPTAAPPAAAAPTPQSTRPSPDEAARVLGAGQPRGPQLIKPATSTSETPAMTTAPASAATKTETRPLTAREKAEMEKSLEDKRKADERVKRAMREQAERQAKEDEIEKKRLAREQKQMQERAREQAKRDAEAAAKAAKAAERQAEIDRKQQKSIEEAAAKLKAAEAAYQAEVAKKNQQQPQQQHQR